MTFRNPMVHLSSGGNCGSRAWHLKAPGRYSFGDSWKGVSGGSLFDVDHRFIL